MRKIVGVMGIIMALLLVGCAAAPTTAVFTERKAWQFNASSTSNGEGLTFTAKRFEFNSNRKTEIASGELTFSLRESAATTEKIASTKLSTKLSLVHNASSFASGKTDSIASEVEFSTASLFPIQSNKTLTLGSSSPERGYTATTDYGAKTSTIKTLAGDEQTFTLKSGAYYDNETLYHLVRAIPSFSTGKEYTFSLLTPYDVYAGGEFFTHELKISVASELSKQEVPESVYEMAIGREGEDSGKLNNSGVFEIDCFYVRITLNTEKSGPAIYMYLSALKFIDNETIRNNQTLYPDSYTSLVPVKIITAEYNLSNIQTYSNEYSLTAYSTRLF